MHSIAMLDPARYIADFARFVANKATQEQHDVQALAELERRPLGLAPGLELRWLGVSGYSMTFEGHTLLIDPYVSRVPLSALIRRKPALPDPALIDRYIARRPTASACLSATPTSTTRSTPRRSPRASAATCTARRRWRD